MPIRAPMNVQGADFRKRNGRCAARAFPELLDVTL